ncbi:unnamed protein product [Clonostachys rosea f. rosea IK726]|uniref:RNA helicase n=2 Tax=Bionectria ochroleuca TaxID=29856 RepID=A0A0B7JNM8_BIOOC|nr:unnamed protein product [Clonostachys rosea f. rosea IK726]
MPHRGASPTPSEGEIDILGSLYPGDDAEQNVPANQDVDFDNLINGPTGDDSDGDEAFIALQQAASYRKASNLKGKTVKKGGGFQAMGLNANLLKAITRKGFSVPTPIQRKTIPLVLDRRDVVGMARTGSGKTAAFVIPMIERLRAHSAKVGARALIMSPSRELAIQTLKVVKEFSRGTDLKCVLLVGGDSLEEQFGFMTANPDIVIATPGRFLHLKVEMSLDLSSIQYVVFDEADRLFEMGFAAQLTEILHALPPSRQTLLFSATLPASLVEFARAGLQDPSLIRLDAETKVSPDLESAFFSVKGAEKEGCLLHILYDIIKVPLGPPAAAADTDEKGSKKRKRGPEKPTEHSTIVFTATKHHVEYIATLLRESGFAVSHVYGSLDQTARRIQIEDFRNGKTNILVVTDVAARGVDIPVLANVINYDFPTQPKIFVHRVGRTARAGRQGWSYSLVRDLDAPYLIDLQLFLGKRLVVGREELSPSFTEDVVVGALKRDNVEVNVEWLNKILKDVEDINALRKVAGKAEKLYMKTRNSAASQSVKRAREMVKSNGWMQLHPVFGDQDADGSEQARANMLAVISGYRPNETIFEASHGDKGKSRAAEVMRNIRQKITPKNRVKADEDEDDDDDDEEEFEGVTTMQNEDNSDEEMEEAGAGAFNDDDDDDGLEVTVSNTSASNKGKTDWRDSEVFMSYTPRTINSAEERGYGTAKSFGVPTRSKMRWDSKSRKYVSRDNDEDGSKGAKMVVGESGVKIAASFQSGRFDRWKRAQRIGKMPRFERPGASNQLPSGARYKHKQEKAPKEADKYRDDFRVRKKRVDEAREKRIGRFRDGDGSKKEIKGITDIRKARDEKDRRKAKNARPSKRKF